MNELDTSLRFPHENLVQSFNLLSRGKHGCWKRLKTTICYTLLVKKECQEIGRCQRERFPKWQLGERKTFTLEGSHEVCEQK